MSKKRTSIQLPMGYAEQVMDLEMKLEEEESLQVIEILTKMYKIGVDFYLQNDIKRASYLLKKLNNLVVRQLDILTAPKELPAKKRICKQLREQTEKISNFELSYITSWVKQSQRSQKKIKDCVQADLDKQEQRFKNRMLQRIKSSGKL